MDEEANNAIYTAIKDQAASNHLNLPTNNPTNYYWINAHGVGDKYLINKYV